MGILGGIIAGGLSGGGQAVADVAQGDIDQAHKSALMQQQSNLELQKMQAAEEFKANFADQMRQRQVTNINNALPGIVDSHVQSALPDLPGAEDGGDNGLRNAQQQQQDSARQSLMNDPRLRTQAAEQLGYIPPGTVAGLQQKDDNARMIYDARMDQNNARREMAQERAENQRAIAEMHNQTWAAVAAIRHGGDAAADKEARLAVTAQLDKATGALREINSESATVAQRLQLSTDPEEQAQLKTQLKSLGEDAKRLHEVYNAAMGVLGGQTGAPPPPPPPPPPPAPDPNAKKPDATAPGMGKGWGVRVLPSASAGPAAPENDPTKYTSAM